MRQPEAMAASFDEHRPHLRAVAYRMLGSLSEADDAVQDAWLRFSRSDLSSIDNLGGWLTTLVARSCLDLLRRRQSRRETPIDAALPDPIISVDGATDPEHQAILADGVGVAMLVVLDSLAPAERLAFVLHDTFGVPFDEIGPIVGRSPAASRQLASRARRRVRQSGRVPDADVATQREVVTAFLAAARHGDFEALLEVLDPDAVLRADAGEAQQVRGATAFAKGALRFSKLARNARHVLVNGAPGLIVITGEGPVAVLAFTIVGNRIVEVDVISNRRRLEPLVQAGWRGAP